MKKPAVIEWIQETAAEAELVLSVCSGALLLAQAGLLDGLEATTHGMAVVTLCGLLVLACGLIVYAEQLRR